MRRTPILDKATGFITQVFRMESAEERAEYEKSVLRNPPPGFVNAIRWINNDEFVIAPTKVLPPAIVSDRLDGDVMCTGVDRPGGTDALSVAVREQEHDGLETLSKAQLKTRCARASIPYDEKTEPGEMIALLRAKAAAEKTGAS